MVDTGCGSNHSQEFEGHHPNHQGLVYGKQNRPANPMLTKSFINFSSNLPSIAASFNYSYVPFSKEEREVYEDNFKRSSSAFEWFQKYAKIKRYGSSSGDNFNIQLKQYNALQGHHYLHSKESRSDVLWLTPKVLQTNTNQTSRIDQPDFLKYRNSKNSTDVYLTNQDIHKTERDTFGYIPNLLKDVNFNKHDMHRNKRESDNNGEGSIVKYNSTIVEEDQEITHEKKKTKKSRKHKRMYIDKHESSTNVTILNGQTALLTCTVRNVGNKSVS